MPIDVEDWYLRHGPMVYRRCHSLLRDDGLAQDATQEVFVQVLRRAHTLDDSAPVSLLWRIATNVCLNRLRTRRRRPEDPDAMELVERIAAIDDGVGESGIRRALDRLFQREPSSTRTMAVLHWVDGLTLQETADEMHMSVSGVRKRLRTLQQRVAGLPEREELA